MIKISQLKLPIQYTDQDFMHAITKVLRLPPDKIKGYSVIKKSIDARKKENIRYIFTVEVTVSNEKETSLINRLKNPNVMISEDIPYSFHPSGSNKLSDRPIVVGSGPAGLFCAWLLAKHGYQPLVIERGEEIGKRVDAVEQFWRSNELNPESNVQFGEGGAGTFSDGKLNTMVKDVSGRCRLVMETFASYGAPSDILILSKPHIGTDKLRLVVENMRRDIIGLGGEFRFQSKLTDLTIENERLTGIKVNRDEVIPCTILIPAIGHSARDTFRMFLKNGLEMSPKAFAVGLRMEHKQNMISEAQYGSQFRQLPPADYKLTHQTQKGRGVYSFCMCPGGFVVNASSEQGRLAVNGMSNYERDGENANSAVVVTVSPEDFGGTGPLSGIAFQRRWEESAYRAGNGSVPVQLFGDLLRNRESMTIGKVKPNIRGSYRLTNLSECLPGEIISSIQEGILAFDKKIRGFANEEAVLAGVETRTSSPVRIHRNEGYESNIKGIYPCGEGAGYAGGIISAAMDGIKVFEAIAAAYYPSYE